MNLKNQQARERAAIILRVRSGQITAAEGARLMGVSRKTYYQWEQRALKGMMAQLEPLAPGRPEKLIDPEKETMTRKIAELEARLKVAEQTAEVRAILRAMDQVASKKKPKSS